MLKQVKVCEVTMIPLLSLTKYNFKKTEVIPQTAGATGNGQMKPQRCQFICGCTVNSVHHLQE